MWNGFFAFPIHNLFISKSNLSLNTIPLFFAWLLLIEYFIDFQGIYEESQQIEKLCILFSFDLIFQYLCNKGVSEVLSILC